MLAQLLHLVGYELRKFNRFHLIIMVGISLIVFLLLSFWEGTGMKQKIILEVGLSYNFLLLFIILWWLFHTGSVHGNDLVLMSNGIKPSFLFISKILATFLMGLVALSLWFIVRYAYGTLFNLPVPSYLSVSTFGLFLLYLASVIITFLIAITILFDYNFLIALLGQLAFSGLILGIVYVVIELSKATDSEAREIADAVFVWVPDILMKKVITNEVSLTLTNYIKLVVSSVVLVLTSYFLWTKLRVYGIRRLFAKA